MMETIISVLNSAIIFILVISIIVFIHEFGHYYVAKLSGVKIEVFSIGFGKILYSWNDKSQTKWQLCMIPLGGYVKMFGDKGASSVPDTEKLNSLDNQESKLAFHNQPLLNRFAIVAAGPIANYLLAILIFCIFFTYYGIPSASAVINQIAENSPAHISGLKSGDLITEINDYKIENFSDIQKIMLVNQGELLEVKLIRDNQEIELKIQPQVKITKDIIGNEIKSSFLGVSSGAVNVKKISLIEAPYIATKEAIQISYLTLKSIGQILTGKRDAQEIGGPIRIAKYSTHSAKQGLASILWFMAIISINLGLVNLLPIPMLDGGHLFFYLIEGIIGRPLPEKIQQIGFQLGLFLLIMLFIFSTFNDLKSLNLF